jgi:uncharacterized protein YecE (DUF72 family)
VTTQKIEVGTSGWQYDHWRGDFYPELLPKSRWFLHYASVFSTVELNNSFYRQPKNEAWEHWHDQAPARFCYAVKANRFITHIKRFRIEDGNDGSDPIDRFLDGAERLKSHLGPVLFQAPPNFHRKPENLERLDEFFSLMPRRIRSVIEFRHKSWYDDETYELLRRRHVSFCIHDMSKLETPMITTGPIAYLRFHGSGARYGGNYSDEMLHEWTKQIRALSSDVESVWCFFNNDIGGHAPRNAVTLREMLAD